MSVYTDGNCKTFLAGAALAQYRRVKLVAGLLQLAAATDSDIGTMTEAAFAANEHKTVRLKNAQGTCLMVAAGAFDQFAEVYGAADGKVDDVSNENFIGVALEASSGDGAIVEVLRQVRADALDNLGAIDGNVVIDDDFLGDWPAAGTALSGQGPHAWTKVETNGLGVISQDSPNGVLKFSADAVAEAATNALYMVNNPVDIDQGPIFECLFGVFDIGDDVAVDVNFGLADDTHATDAGLIANSIFFHLNGDDLSLFCESDDAANEVAETDTGVDLVDDTFYAFRIDVTDKSDVKFYYRPLTTQAWTRLLPGTTFDMSNYAGTLTPIIHVEKTSNDTTYDFRADRVRVQAGRN